MRISDWSSDVCSSDLNPDASSYPMLMRSMKAMIAAMPQLRRHALNGAMTFGALMLFWGTYAGHVQQSLDRKSVVSGKSVSVLVDHGGSRIIKKKKRYTYIN